MTLLSAKGIYKEYHSHLKSLYDTDLEVSKGSRIGIVGETGSGKSTLLRVLAGLEQPSGGNVIFKGKKVLGPEEQLVAGHPSIAYLAQQFELRKFVTVEECIYSPFKLSEAEAYKIYNACDIEHLIERQTSELSGGEKQRVALAVLLAKKPEILLLDEPFSSLDPHHKELIKKVISNIEKQLKTTIMMVAHDPLDILSWASEVLVMRTGKILQKDDPKEIYERPRNPYIAGLFGSFNRVDPTLWDVAKLSNFNHFRGKAIIRPHHFKINKKGKGVEGKVIAVNYYGEQDKVSIKTLSETIVCLTNTGSFKIDDNVFLTVNITKANK